MPSLDSDVLEKIFTHAAPIDAIRAAAVCTHWRDAAQVCIAKCDAVSLLLCKSVGQRRCFDDSRRQAFARICWCQECPSTSTSVQSIDKIVGEDSDWPAAMSGATEPESEDIMARCERLLLVACALAQCDLLCAATQAYLKLAAALEESAVEHLANGALLQGSAALVEVACALAAAAYRELAEPSETLGERVGGNTVTRMAASVVRAWRVEMGLCQSDFAGEEALLPGGAARKESAFQALCRLRIASGAELRDRVRECCDSLKEEWTAVVMAAYF